MSKIELIGPNHAMNRVMELAVHARGCFKKSASTYQMAMPHSLNHRSSSKRLNELEPLVRMVRRYANNTEKMFRSLKKQSS